MKRTLIHLLTTAALMATSAPWLTAQNGGNSGLPEDKITVVSAEGRSILVTEDGGKTWRWIRGSEGEDARQEAIRSLQNALHGGLMPTAVAAASPDPATGVVAIPLKAMAETMLAGHVELRLYDNRGRQTDIQQIELNPSQPTIPYNTASLPNGIYSFSLRCGGVVAGVGRIVVAR